jgi:signal transduction histidine kinase
MVGTVMALGGFFILRQRFAILETATRNELVAHAQSLKIALEDAFLDPKAAEAQRLINRLGENPRIYSVIIFDERKNILMLSNPDVSEAIRNPLTIERVIEKGETIEFTQGEEVYSIILPINISNKRRLAVQISQPRSFLIADRANARRDIALITLLLFGSVVLTVLIVARQSLLRPVIELLKGAEAIGSGNLNYRVMLPNGAGEFTRLAYSFNQMADKLLEQRKKVENDTEERLQLERKLNHSERLAFVGRVAAGVAHEIGAPLNVIKGRVEMIQSERVNLSDKQQRNLTIINSQADVIARIIRQLLNLARPYHLYREKLKAGDLVEEVVELIESEAAGRRVRIDMKIQNDCLVFGDRKLLQQVLLNICLNGIHAIENDGVLSIIVDKEIAPDSPSSANGKRMVKLLIWDTGKGIALQDLAHVFDPFFTTKDPGKGTGLGLSVSRRIVEEHGGWIKAANRVEGGAAFTIYLPEG